MLGHDLWVGINSGPGDQDLGPGDPRSLLCLATVYTEINNSMINK